MASARTLNQILTELSPTYDSQVNNLRQRASLIPQQIAEEEKGLEARQTQAFGDILGGARRRGLGFSGIPLEEQARYTSTEFLPALARLRQSGREQALSLEDAILGINERRNTLAQQLYQQEQDRAFQAAEAQRQREFAAHQAELDRAAQRRAAAAAATPTLSGLLSGGGSQPKKQSTGFIGNNDYRGRLAYEAKQGDADARVMLRYVGNDGRAGGGVSPEVYQILKRNGIGGNYFATVPGVRF